MDTVQKTSNYECCTPSSEPSRRLYYFFTNSVALVCEGTLLTELPQFVDEVSVNFCGQKSVE
jgi:hypothetical protein